jgi:hypothetical protein
LGLKTATVTIPNDDADENPYDFTITGTGIIPPDINVKQNTTNIPDGTGSYSYGTVTVLSSKPIVFTIENLGEANLALIGTPIVQVSGTDASMFSVTVQPTTPVAGGASVTFTVAFTPASAGAKTATISIPCNMIDRRFLLGFAVLPP